MRKYNKLRGIVRAKQGSQVPKLLLGGTWNIMQQYNQNSIGSSQGQQLPDASDFSLPNLQLPSIDFKPELPETAQQKYYNNTLNTALGKPQPKYSSMVNSDKLLQDTLNKKKFTNTKFGKGVSKAGNFVGNLITDNSEAIMGIGANIARNSVDIQGEGFGKFDRATQGIAAFGKQIGGPVGGVVSAFATGINTWGNVINALGAKRLQNFSVNKDVQSRVGSSYGGSYTDILKAGDLSGKKVGLFGGARNKNNFIDDQRIVQGKIARIDAENQNLQAMAGNDLNYLGYQMQQDGGYDQLLMGMRAKQGGVLQKINLVKSKRLNKDTINLDTKEIEWKPIIEDMVEEFKDGGVFPSHVDNSSINYPVCKLEWEPVIELFEEWEPVIELEMFQEGGSIKKSFEEWFNSIPKDSRASGYDYKKAHEVLDWETLYNHTKDPEKYHLYSVSPIADENGNYPFLKLGKLEENPELQGEFDWYNSEEGTEHKSKFDIEYINDRYYYVPKKLKDGGKTKEELETPKIEETNQKNLIPEGALHKNKHHMEHTEGLTQKGIPVIDNDGEQQAEIELDEIIFTLEVTKKLEELYKDGSDEAAIEAGKLLVKEILFNTDDRTGLISKCEKGGKL